MNRKLFFACALAVATVGCQDMPGAGPAGAGMPANAVPPVITAASDELVGPVWQWQRTMRRSAPAIVAAAPARYTLSFDGGGRVNVRADCNRGSGSYEVDGATLRFGAIAVTRMGCPSGSQDTEFLRSLVEVARYGMAGGELLLTLADGAVMHFRPAQ